MKWLLFIVLAGCGDDSPCPAACDRLYLDCNAGDGDEDDLVKECLDECGEAYKDDGSVGDYEPRKVGGKDSPENIDQVEEWAECVTYYGCEHLDYGFCDPGW